MISSFGSHIDKNDSLRMIKFLGKVAGHEPTKDDFRSFFKGMLDAGLPPSAINDFSRHIPKQAAKDVFGGINIPL